MDAAHWTQRYVTGHAGIDAQHQVLFTLVERVRRDLAGPGDHRQVVLDLMKYVVEHFNYELSLMRQHGYEDFGVHHAGHQRFIHDVVLLKQAVFANEPAPVSMETFLQSWIEHHIDDDDRRLAEFLGNSGIGL